MGKYTVPNDPQADAAVQAALNRMVDSVVTLMDGHLDAIVLTGGFGRGEGGVIRENGRFRPVNDFDIAVIVSRDYLRVRRQFAKPLAELAEKLAPETGVKQIDIGISHPLRFRFAPNLVASYEVRNGHRVLWGEMDLKRLMPQLPEERLPLLDGAIYFLSRGSGLLIPAMYFLPDGKIQERHRENFQIEVDKACMAMGDALLLLRRQYHYSYAERQRRLEAMDLRDVPEGKMVRRGYLRAVEQKLRPRFDWPGDEAMVGRWFQVRDGFGRFFLWFEGIRLRRSFRDWKAHSAFVERHVKDPLGDRMRVWMRSAVRSGSVAMLGPRGREARFRQSRPFRWATMPMLLFSLKPDGVNFDLLRRGQALLGLRESDGTLEAWQEAVREYLGGFHPEGVIRELLEEEDV